MKASADIQRCKTCRKVDFFGLPRHLTKAKGSEGMFFEYSQKVQAALTFWSYHRKNLVFDENTDTAALSLFVGVYCECKAKLYVLVLYQVSMLCKH